MLTAHTFNLTKRPYDIILQVAWLGLTEKVTWEPACTLPKDLIEKYEAGMTSTTESVITAESYGAITHTHTIVTSSKTTPDRNTEPLAKRAKVSLSMEKGYMINVCVHSSACMYP